MCKWGDTVELEVTMVARLSHTGKRRTAVKDIDRCIVPIVKALNDAGIVTLASCCGHGKQMGTIAIEDGREILIAPDFKTARKISDLFPPIND